MAENFLLPDVSSTIRHGKEETLVRPPVFSCSAETHQPFLVHKAPVEFEDQHGLFLCGVVRTVGAQFDGDRTDIHDIFPILWSALIRAFGIASPSMIYEEHPFVPGEIGACHVLFTQSPWRVRHTNFEKARHALVGWTAYGFHLLDGVFQWHRVSRLTGPDRFLATEMKSNWVYSVNRYLNTPRDATCCRRHFPNWQYFSSREKGITVFRMSGTSISNLKQILSPFTPEKASGEKGIVLLAHSIPNVIPYETIKKGRRLLDICETKQDQDPIILPFDTHCIFIGKKTVVAIQGDFGHSEFKKEQELLFKRRQVENRVFYANSTIHWKIPIPARSLEDLCLELILREPGVARAKPVGDTNDRDGGRDLVVDWHLPHQHQVIKHDSHDSNSSTSGGVKLKRIIVQVKYRSKTIGKRDVQDIRDTIEHYEADGFLLIAHPKVSSQLFDHLEKLRTKTGFLTEWWDQSDLERKLRQHPDIARRYPDVLDITY